jgi:hypothetical protein
MRRLLLVLLCLLGTAQLRALTNQTAGSGCTAAAASCTLGSHNFADLEVTCAYRASNTAPTLPGTYKSISTGGLNTWSQTCGWRFLDGTETVTGTFTNGTRISATVWRGSGGVGATPGLANASATTTMTYCGTAGGTGCSQSLAFSGGTTSWLVAFGGCSACTAGDTLSGANGGVTWSQDSGVSVTALSVSDSGAAASALTTFTKTVTTSGAIRSAVIEILAAPSTCSSNCPAVLQKRAFGTNDGQQTFNTITIPVPNLYTTGAGTGVLWFFSWDGTAVTGSLSDDGGNTYTEVAAAKCNDGTRVKTAFYSQSPVSASNLTLTTSAAVSNWNSYFIEETHVGAVDVGSCVSTQAGPIIAGGALATTVDNDAIITYAIDEGSLCCINAITAWIPAASVQMFPPNRQLGAEAQQYNQGTHVSYTPKVQVNQATHDNFGVSSVALKQDAVNGPTPSQAVRTTALSVTEFPSGTSISVQFPCPDGNLIVERTAENQSQAPFSAVSDGSGSYTQIFGGHSTFPNAWYRVISPAGFDNDRKVTITSGALTATPIIMLQCVTGADPVTPIGTVTSTTTANQAAVGCPTAGTCSCPGQTGSDLDHAPDLTTTRANSLADAVANNGTGPECKLRGATSTYRFEGTWYRTPGTSTQDDSSTGQMESSSGYGECWMPGSGGTCDFHWDFANATISGSNVLAFEILSPAAAASPNMPPRIFLGISGMIGLLGMFLLALKFKRVRLTLAWAVLVLVATALLSLPAHAQPWSGILSTTRAVDWSTAGATITTGGSQCGSIIAAYTGTAATINTAITGCGSGNYVKLGAGTFTLSTSVINKSGVRVVGSGSNSTFIIFNIATTTACGAFDGNVCFASAATGDGGDNTFDWLASWTAGYAAGTTSITINTFTRGTIAGLQVGGMLFLDQLDDTPTPATGVFVCQAAACSGGGSANGRTGRGQQQPQIVTSITGSGPWTVGITPGVRMPNIVSGKTPQVWGNNGLPIHDAGIESVSLDTRNSGNFANIMCFGCYNVWAKGVRLVGQGLNATGTYEFWAYQSKNVTLRDSYGFGSNATSNNYMLSGFNAADILFENNIKQHMAFAFMGEGCIACVDSYNYAIDDYYTGTSPVGSAPDWQQASSYHHGVGDSFFLWEGNEGIGLTGDNVHGTSNLMTAFRNYWNGRDPNGGSVGGKSSQTNAIILDSYNRFYNIIGNVLGTSTYHTVYQCVYNSPATCSNSGQIYSVGYTDSATTSEVYTGTSLMRWGNYDTVNAATRFVSAEVPSGLADGFANTVPASQTLPSSFYLSSKPAWWGNSIPWPPNGPDVTGGNIANLGGHANHNPAANCYLNVMHGPTDGTATLMAFDPNACYSGASVDIHGGNHKASGRMVH